VKKATPLFMTEAQLCAAFISWAKHFGWTAYAETAGWDLLMVNAAGVQLGVQAKLTLNPKVMDQALERYWHWNCEGPDYRAVLVPTAGCGSLLAALGLGCFVPVDETRYRYRWSDDGRQEQEPISFVPQLPDFRGDLVQTLSGRVGCSCSNWHDWNPEKRHKLPQYVPDVVAGASGPVQLTEWKIKALRLCAVLEMRGFVTRYDFNSIGLDYRRWIGPPNDWLRADGAGRYVRGDGLRFPGQHPTVYAQIMAETAEALRTPGVAA